MINFFKCSANSYLPSCTNYSFANLFIQAERNESPEVMMDEVNEDAKALYKVFFGILIVFFCLVI